MRDRVATWVVIGISAVLFIGIYLHDNWRASVGNDYYIACMGLSYDVGLKDKSGCECVRNLYYNYQIMRKFTGNYMSTSMCKEL